MKYRVIENLLADDSERFELEYSPVDDRWLPCAGKRGYPDQQSAIAAMKRLAGARRVIAEMSD